MSKTVLFQTKFQHHWNLTIRLFSIKYPGHSLEVITLLERCSWRILQPQPTGQYTWNVSNPNSIENNMTS